MEILINRLLQGQDSLLVADELLKKWNSGELDYIQKTEVGFFLLNSGLHTTLKNQILLDLSQNREVSWQILCRLLQLYPDYFNEEFVNPIMLGLLETDRINEVLKTGDFIKLHSRFDNLFEKLLSEKLHSSGVPHIQVNEILKQKEFAILLAGEKIPTEEKQNLLNQLIESAKKNTELAYDIAIAAAHLEEYKTALECLKYAPLTDAKEWLELKLLVEAKNFIVALEKSFDIEAKYSHSPDTILDTLYYRACAYYGLNEKDKALTILKTISEKYPKYQKAKVLYSQWSMD